MKKIMVHIAWVVLLLVTMGAQAGEYGGGGYWGARLGVNTSRADGVINAPIKSTAAYVLQGGYLQGGYIFTSKTLVLGVGGYFDWNPSDQHNSPDGVIYGSRSLGMDAKVGLPFGVWMPYTKLGYGYSTGTKELHAVTGNSLNAAFGVEYKTEPQWSLLGEYKVDGFGGKNGTTSISNKMFTFGFNYYFNAPAVFVAPVVEEVFEEEAPKPVVVPTAVTDAPPI